LSQRDFAQPKVGEAKVGAVKGRRSQRQVRPKADAANSSYKLALFHIISLNLHFSRGLIWTETLFSLVLPTKAIMSINFDFKDILCKALAAQKNFW